MTERSQLGRILAAKRAELPALRRKRFGSEFVPRPFELTGPGVSLLAEIKFRSPSAGALSTVLSAGQRARAYEEAGARMVSVLCDEPFFAGGYDKLLDARRSCGLPLLCKEFIIDESQLDAARGSGADAVLLIVRCLDDEQLAHLYRASVARGLAPLVEVHSPTERQRAIDVGATLIGVNARDLDTLVMDAVGAAQVLASLPPGCTRVHLSGIRSPGDVSALRGRAEAALIGETLMRQDDPRPLLRELVAAGIAPLPAAAPSR